MKKKIICSIKMGSIEQIKANVKLNEGKMAKVVLNKESLTNNKPNNDLTLRGTQPCKISS